MNTFDHLFPQSTFGNGGNMWSQAYDVSQQQQQAQAQQTAGMDNNPSYPSSDFPFFLAQPQAPFYQASTPSSSSSGSAPSPHVSSFPAASLLPYPQSVYTAKPQDLQQGNYVSQQQFGNINQRNNAVIAQGTSNNGDFTKRKNWPSLLIDEYADFLHVLSPTGHFLYSTDSIAALTGYEPYEMIGHSITEYIHQDDIETLVHAFNEAIMTGDEMVIYVRFKQSNGDRYFIFELRGRARYGQEERTGPVPPFTRVTSKRADNTNITTFAVDPQALTTLLGGSAPHASSASSEGFHRNSPNSNECKCFMASARPYPGKHLAMLDDFLEFKMENEKLRNELRLNYEEMEAEGGHSGMDALQLSPALSTSSPQFQQAYLAPTDQSTAPLYSPGFSFPTYNAAASTSYQQQPQLNLDYSVGTSGGMDSSISSDSSGYRPQKRQHVSSTSKDLSASTSKKAAKATETSALDDAAKKSRKASRRGQPGQYVCHDCGTVDSPEWRKGPDGPKSLCNACGLRYAKRSKVPGTGKASPKLKSSQLKDVNED